jgi:hypothetical protein
MEEGKGLNVKPGEQNEGKGCHHHEADDHPGSVHPMPKYPVEHVNPGI